MAVMRIGENERTTPARQVTAAILQPSQEKETTEKRRRRDVTESSYRAWSTTWQNCKGERERSRQREGASFALFRVGLRQRHRDASLAVRVNTACRQSRDSLASGVSEASPYASRDAHSSVLRRSESVLTRLWRIAAIVETRAGIVVCLTPACTHSFPASKQFAIRLSRRLGEWRIRKRASLPSQHVHSRVQFFLLGVRTNNTKRACIYFRKAPTSRRHHAVKSHVETSIPRSLRPLVLRWQS